MGRRDARSHVNIDHLVFFPEFTSSCIIVDTHLLIYLDKIQLPIARMTIYKAVWTNERGKMLKMNGSRIISTKTGGTCRMSV